MKIYGKTSISLIKGGKQYSVDMEDPRYKDAYKLLTSGKDEQFIKLVGKSLEKIVEEKVTDFLTKNNQVFFGRFEIKGALRDKVASLKRDGLSTKPFFKFYEKVLLNPSKQSAEELFDFLSYKELPITDDGNFLAYKGVLNNYYSSHANKKTKVIQGKVNEAGQILNKIGCTIEVERSCVDANRSNECAEGIHAGSLDYARGHANRVVLVEINPKDAVSVPKDCSFQKLRCCKYKVIADFEQEIKAPSVKVVKKKVIENKPKNTGNSKEKDRIANYLANKAALGVDTVKVRSVSGSLSPKTLPVAQVVAIITRLGYKTKDGIVYL